MRNAHKTRTSLGLLLALLVGRQAEAGEPSFSTVTPSFDAWEGCVWQSHRDEKKGIFFLYQDCRKGDPDAMRLQWEKGWFLMVPPSHRATFGGPAIIRLFTKAADEPIRHAIWRVAQASMTKRARAFCKIFRWEEDSPLMEAYPARPVGVEGYKVSATGAYAKEIAGPPGQDDGPIADYGCGHFGEGGGQNLFVYRPQENKTHFAFVIGGMDQPIFDPDSIRFFDPPQR